MTQSSDVPALRDFKGERAKFGEQQATCGSGQYINAVATRVHVEFKTACQ